MITEYVFFVSFRDLILFSKPKPNPSTYGTLNNDQIHKLHLTRENVHESFLS
jgi:hypothetical protein